VAQHVLIIPDKFKGTLTAGATAKAIARGWHKVRPQDRLDLLPMSDGGDGFGEVISKLLHAQSRTVRTLDAAHRPCRVTWWWEPRSRTAIIESARVVGMARLRPAGFHPFNLDTFGLGAVIRAASEEGAQRCIIGIGGSATNDGGFGLARALGWEFLNAAGDPIDRWTDLHKLSRISAPRRRHWFKELIVAVDVQNPLLGMRGSTRVYGPQKGLKPGEFSEAERNLRRLAQVAERGRFAIPDRRDSPTRRKTKPWNNPGTGAAGGLGFGLFVFLQGDLRSGFTVFSELAKLGQRLRRTDVVITGEGKIDASTFMGKGTGQIAERCRQLRIPIIAIAGNISRSDKVRHQFTRARALTDLVAIREAGSKAAFWLEQAAASVASKLRSDGLSDSPSIS
jgi:glycerate 2-kinase